MATLLQLHFAFNGPFGDAMAEQLKPLAESINQEPGFLWKVWTESEKNHEAGGLPSLIKAPCLSGKTHCPTEKSRR